jgi:hypothetical protein
MITVQITLELNEETARTAQDLGLFENNVLASWIDAEVKRQRLIAGNRLLETMETVSAQFRSDYGHLSDSEQQDLLENWIREAREEL